MAQKLREYLADWRGRPWSWGISDCCTFACNRVRDLTGVDPMADFRNRYRSQATAERLIADAGGLSAILAAVAAEHGGLPEIAVARFRDGVEVGALTAEGWCHIYTPKGVHSLRLGMVDLTVMQ